MKQIKRINDDMVEIDGDRYFKSKGTITSEALRMNWPTSTEGVVFMLGYNKGNIPVNDLDHSKANKITSCLDAARAINGDWIPNWEDDKQKYYPLLMLTGIVVECTALQYNKDFSFIYFPTIESCQHFIKYFGDIWLEAIG